MAREINEFSTPRWHLIEVIGRLQSVRKKPVPYLEIVNAMPEKMKEDCRKNLSNFYQNRKIWIERSENAGGERGNTLAYRLNQEGMKIHKYLNDIKKVDVASTAPIKYKKKNKSPPPVTPMAPQLNLSSAADNLADMTAQVVQENSNLRDLMINSCATMAGQLGYKLVKINGEDDGSHTTTS